jgi:hypothetical protein
VGGGALFALFDVGDFFGWGDPLLGGNVIYRGLDALCVALGKESQVFVAYPDFGPHAFVQHGGYNAMTRGNWLPYRRTAGSGWFVRIGIR